MSQLSYLLGGEEKAPAPEYARHTPEASKGNVSIDKLSVKHMGLPELRTACRQYGVSPAGSRDVLQERLQERLEEIEKQTQPSEPDWMAQTSEEMYPPSMTQPPHIHKKANGAADVYDDGPSYPPLGPAGAYGYSEFPERLDEPQAPSAPPSQALDSGGVSHMFGGANEVPAYRPSKGRCGGVGGEDYSSKEYDGPMPAGVPRHIGEIEPPAPREVPEIGAFNSTHLDHLFSPKGSNQSMEREGFRGEQGSKISDSRGMAGVLQIDNHEYDVPPQNFSHRSPSSPPPNSFAGLAPYSNTAKPPSRQSEALDKETVQMVQALGLQELRAMLRKRGINPAGSREALQERLTTYLMGDAMDVEFHPHEAPGQWDTSALEQHSKPSSQRSSTKVLAPPGGGQSSLDYLFSG